jgi:hypothetical protein
MPAWLEAAVHNFMPTSAPGAAVLTAGGLWSAIQHWDIDTPGQQRKFLSDNEVDNKYMVAAFLANTNHESLSAFSDASTFDANYGINELICNGNVGHCLHGQSGDRTTDAGSCPGSFVQSPSDCTTSWGGEYGIYWGRGALQVTCRKGTGPNGSDLCPAYSDIGKYYAGYLAEHGWTLQTIEAELAAGHSSSSRSDAA